MISPLFSEKYQDIYCNPDNPEGEKQFVFIEANRIAERIKTAETFIVAELGFGYGINHHLTVAAAQSVDCVHKLQYFSCDESLPVQTKVPVFVGDVRDFLAQATFQADVWYFDGFSPAKNPKMWSAEVFARAFALTNANGTFSTYSAAGWVKRNLIAAGYHVEKTAGYGGKREMLVGYKKAAESGAEA